MGDRARSARGTGGLPARRRERLRPHHTYRLANGTTVHLHDPSLARPLIWIGEGLAEVGIMPGRPLTTEQQSAARALMDGVDLADVYEPSELEYARAHRDARVRIRLSADAWEPQGRDWYMP
ncbi:hypothetical protein [Microtetraspora malaysiensis]|uniref:hypothetical protein n=1 Tax=Microtetraspora malaysiensis TaxID=161358 RepID=UPI000829BF02|nr:hypothetical protein [Microtetraspora malaysiensis]